MYHTTSHYARMYTHIDKAISMPASGSTINSTETFYINETCVFKKNAIVGQAWYLYTSNLSTRKAEAGDSTQVQGQPGLQGKL